MLHKSIIIVILTSSIAAFTGVSGNIVSNLVSDSWKPYLWIAWPIFIFTTLAGSILGIYQVVSKPDNNPSNKTKRESNRNWTGKSKEINREIRILGIPVFSFRENNEERSYRILGLPIYLKPIQIGTVTLNPSSSLIMLIVGSAIGIIPTAILDKPQDIIVPDNYVISETLQPPPPNVQDEIDKMISLINASRASAGCPSLKTDIFLTESSMNHAEEISRLGKISHISQNGGRVSDRATNAGYSWGRIGEVIASGYSSTDKIVSLWLQSPSHRDIITNCDFQDIGIGYGYSNIINKGPYWVATLATPR